LNSKQLPKLRKYLLNKTDHEDFNEKYLDELFLNKRIAYTNQYNLPSYLIIEKWKYIRRHSNTLHKKINLSSSLKVNIVPIFDYKGLRASKF
jgi:hypothetical protein